MTSPEPALYLRLYIIVPGSLLTFHLGKRGMAPFVPCNAEVISIFAQEYYIIESFNDFRLHVEGFLGVN